MSPSLKVELELGHLFSMRISPEVARRTVKPEFHPSCETKSFHQWEFPAPPPQRCESTSRILSQNSSERPQHWSNQKSIGLVLGQHFTTSPYRTGFLFLLSECVGSLGRHVLLFWQVLAAPYWSSLGRRNNVFTWNVTGGVRMEANDLSFLVPRLCDSEWGMKGPDSQGGNGEIVVLPGQPNENKLKFYQCFSNRPLPSGRVHKKGRLFYRYSYHKPSTGPHLLFKSTLHLYSLLFS